MKHKMKAGKPMNPRNHPANSMPMPKYDRQQLPVNTSMTPPMAMSDRALTQGPSASMASPETIDQ